MAKKKTKQEVHQELLVDSALAYDKKMLLWSTKGVPLKDEKGNPVLTEDGEQAYREPSGAEMQAVRSRLANCNITTAPMQGSPLMDAAETLGYDVAGKIDGSKITLPGDLPECSYEDDAATA